MSDQTNQLEAAITRTSAMLTAEPADGRGGWAFTRCWLHVTRFELSGNDPAALQAALDDFDAIPTGVPGRPKLAAVLVNCQIRAGRLREGPAIRRAAALADLADTDPQPLPAWPTNRAVIRALTLMKAGQEGDPTISVRSALKELDELDAVVAGVRPQADILEFARIGLAQLRSEQDMDHEGLEESRRQAEEVARRHGPGSPLHGRAWIMTTLMDVQAAMARGDVATVTTVLEQIRSSTATLSPQDPMRPELERMLASVAPYLDLLRKGAQHPGGFVSPSFNPVPEDGALAELRRMTELPASGPAERAMRLANLGMAEVGFGISEVRLMDDGIRHLAEAVATAEAHDPRLAFYLGWHGYALLQRYETTHRQPDLMEGGRVIEEARKLVDSPAHPSWAMVNQMLGHAHRLAGRRQLGREVGLESLRGHAWSVLLQAHTAAATTAARDAAGDAIDIARWCLEDNDPDGAVTALDAGRGLIVYAATQMQGIAEQLDGEHPGLAARWRTATAGRDPGEVDVELRREVLSTLAGLSGEQAATGRFLDPPSPHEIRAALVALGADALVYLVPGDQGTGAAVVVPARGPSVWRPLRKLSGLAMTEFDLRSRRDRDAGEADATADRLPSLDEVCAWAWDAAIGPVLDMVDLPKDGSGRIILIPMRELVRVPWHAAHRRRWGREQYAIQRAGFSYAASARLMCDSAWSTEVGVGATGLIVGDPDTRGAAPDLPGARTEALAIRTAFYGSARYVGRFETGAVSTAGPGGRRDVLDWLTNAGGGAMLHLACHAVVDPEATAGHSAYLLLAGGERLSAEDLVRGLGARAGRDIALATLAACRTGVSSRGYDEAFSLATTFLANKVRSVVSSQWAVPDEATSVLMFAFHQFLHSGDSVADALRKAQLWLLDGDRAPLPEMPDALRQRLAAAPVPDIADWAAFIHAGR